MTVERVALIPECAECGDRWVPGNAERWRCYLDGDGEPVFDCVGCAELKFGDD